MSMTKMERDTRRYLMNVLRKQGYPTYASLLYRCDLNFHNPPEPFAASMDPKSNVIYINPTITDTQALSTLIRHEILHNYLKHHLKLMRHLAKKHGVDFGALGDISILDSEKEIDAAERSAKKGVLSDRDKKIKELERELYSSDKFNIAADYDISNKGYTDADKEIQRNIGKYGNIFETAQKSGFKGSVEDLRGLVTEDDHPEWLLYSVEEMYDELTKKIEREKDALEDEDEESDDIIVGFISGDGAQFFDIEGNTIYGGVD